MGGCLSCINGMVSYESTSIRGATLGRQAGKGGTASQAPRSGETMTVAYR